MSETNELRPAELHIPEAVLDAVIEALGDCYDCTRVWNAWSHGTMSQHDFVQVAESPERVEEIARAAITALFLSEGSADESLRATELDTLRVRVGEMAAEIERLNGVIAERVQGDLIQGNCYEAGLWSMRNAEAMIEDGNVINGESLRATCIMGVGDGSGNLFVHGDYDSIKAAQRITDDRSRLIELAAALTVATKTEYTEAATAVWNSLPQHLQEIIDAAEERLEASLEADDGGHVDGLPDEPRCPSSLHDTAELDERIAVADRNCQADKSQRRIVGKTEFYWNRGTQRWSVFGPAGAL